MTDISSQKYDSQALFTRRLFALVALGFLALIVAAIAVAWVQGKNEDDGRWVQHTLQTEARLGAFASAIERAETSRRGLLLSGAKGFGQRLDEASAEAGMLLEDIAQLTRDNPDQQRRVAELRELRAAKRVAEEEVRRDRAGAARRAAALDFESDRGVQLTRRMRTLANEMLASEQALLAKRDAEQAATLSTFYGVLIATGVLLILVAGTTIAVMMRYTRELAASRAELRLLNEDLEAMVAVRTAELQRANEEIQRFAYIVSHDLRSPLVNVMGFTAELDAARKTVAEFVGKLEGEHPDLVEESARLAVTEDLPEAIGFIRTSTQKMDRLINAILRLSREGRRTLAPERVDAHALVTSIVDSMQHRVSDTGAEIAVEPLPDIVTDRLALEQILSNLIENAVKYLQPGRPGFIRVSGHTERDRIVYEVTDNGRGIDPRDHERVFDLFRRSGQQDQPGEGIGLAHVRALAYRLGGLIEVRSELDRGSTFRLSLPATLKAGDLE